MQWYWRALSSKIQEEDNMRSMVINTRHQVVSLISIFILTSMLTIGCGSDPKSDCSAPSNASIIVNGPGVFSVGFDTNFDFTVVVLYNDGKPMPQACMTISSAFAFPRNATATGSRYQFYAYPGGTQNLANIPVDNGFSAKTDDFGQYTFSALYIAGTGTYKDTVTVRSGAVIGTANFEVQ